MEDGGERGSTSHMVDTWRVQVLCACVPERESVCVHIFSVLVKGSRPVSLSASQASLRVSARLRWCPPRFPPSPQ